MPVPRIAPINDLFEKLRIGLMLHRSHFRDPDVLTAGKALEMVTIDAARALGLEKILGLVEVGKKADLILINTDQPHLHSLWQEPLRLVYQVAGHDVDTAIVNGRVLMEGRAVRDCLDPSRPGVAVGRYRQATDADVARAVECAADDPDCWRSMAVEDRWAVLGRVADPTISLSLSTMSSAVGQDAREVVLAVTLEAKNGDVAVYLAEVKQAGVFVVRGFGVDETRRILGSFAPNILFPYIRQTVSDIVEKGGFPPFLLPHVNFDALFERSLQEQAARQAQAAPAPQQAN